MFNLINAVFQLLGAIEWGGAIQWLGAWHW